MKVASSLFLACSGLALILVGAETTRAEVVRVEIESRKPFAGGLPFGAAGAYEKVSGRLHYSVDPRSPANARIVDLKRAPVDARGRVAFVGAFILLKPVNLAKGNHRLLYDVNNRGGLPILPRLNRGEGSNDPETVAHAGNGFLMRHGYSILWSGWNWDVLPGAGRMQIDLPIATEDGKAITGRVAAEIVVNERSVLQPVAWGDSRGYEAADASTNQDATLTVRDEQRAPRVEIARERWRFADPTHVGLDGGFAPGRIYELVYTAKDPRVVGLGLAAIRDAISFFRFSARDEQGTPNPLSTAGSSRPDPERAIIFGISQSGRVIQHMLYEGLHVDEAGRMVFDAAMLHVSGGARGSFNHRFAQTTRHPSPLEDHQYPADLFPATTVPERDPVTGAQGDALGVAKAMGKVPVLMYTLTSTEYWTRAASLLHTDVTGARDAAVDEHARIYFIAGGQHGISASRERVYEHPGNPLDHSPPLRALLLALDRWATTGAKPPDSAYPRLDRGELVGVAAYADGFPRIPGVRVARRNLQPARLDLGASFTSEGVVSNFPAGLGPPYVTLVPATDADGNDRAGIRLPEVAAPLGTYTGWNLRRAEMGALDQLARWSGSYFGFAPTEALRAKTGDPRPSIEARYKTKEDYLRSVEAAIARLRAQGFLLDEDAAAYLGHAHGSSWPPAAP
jgi:Alpha/beta hydrolase domain